MRNKKEIIIEAIVEGMVVEMMSKGLNNAFKHYGIEGTEQVIKEVYKHTPKLRDMYLGFYYRVIGLKGVE